MVFSLDADWLRILIVLCFLSYMIGLVTFDCRCKQHNQRLLDVQLGFFVISQILHYSVLVALIMLGCLLQKRKKVMVLKINHSLLRYRKAKSFQRTIFATINGLDKLWTIDKIVE